MTLLLDEQIDVRLKPALTGLAVNTLPDLDWQGLTNGILREKINEAGFDFFVTADKNLPFQQNLAKINFVLILLDTPTLLWEHQALFAPKIIDLVQNFAPDPLLKIIHVSIDGFNKGRKRQQSQRTFPPEQIRFV